MPAAFQDPTPAPGERSTLPAGSRLLRHTPDQHRSRDRSARYRLDATFPDGIRAHAVREALPKLRKGEAGPRVRLARRRRPPGARLRVDRLKQGDPTSMQHRAGPANPARPAGSSPASLLSVLYLVYFRDLVCDARGLVESSGVRAPLPPRSLACRPCPTNVATSAEDAAKIVPRAEFRVFGQNLIEGVKAKMWNGKTVLFQARRMPMETYFLSRLTNEANVKVRDGLLDIKTKTGETPDGYEIFQPRGKFQFPVKTRRPGDHPVAPQGRR